MKIHLTAYLFFGLFCITQHISAQAAWTGTYTGEFNNDRVQMELYTPKQSQIQGSIKDSYSQYEVEARAIKDTLRGKATDKNLGLEFDLLAVKTADKVEMVLSFEFLGSAQKLEMVLYKSISNKAAAGKSDQKQSTNPVAGKTRDPKLAGTWVKESNYSSGYGSNGTYGSMSTQETMVFYQDGTMANGPSSTVVGGSNYTGTSSSEATNRIEGLYWYNQGNRLFLYAVDQGKAETVELGTYYIEGNNMLITATNGNKTLLSRR
jgi:hypothetical protein